MTLINNSEDNYVVINDPEQFLKFFGNKEKANALIDFLNHMLENRGDNVIESITAILDTCEDVEIASKRQSILDALCKEKGGDYSITQVVISKSGSADFQKQIIEYACGTYLTEAEPGGKYENVTKVSCLALLDFIVYPDNPDATFIKSIEAKTTDGQMLKPFNIVCKELPKFGNLPQNFTGDVK